MESWFCLRTKITTLNVVIYVFFGGKLWIILMESTPGLKIMTKKTN
jgi:hypothetical protein